MKHTACLSLLGVLLVASRATSCHKQLPENEAAEHQEESAYQADTGGSRQKAIRLLASRLRWYHDGDSAAMANPGATDGEVLDIGKRRFVFKTRADLRADLNRVLDSLRRTGPLVMGNAKDATDTISYKGPSVRSVQTK
jgi:hypothetical protein